MSILVVLEIALKIGTFHFQGLWIKVVLPGEPGEEVFEVKEAFKKRPFTWGTLTPSEQRELFERRVVRPNSGGEILLFE